MLREGILAACDADDGLAGGLVSNPGARDFDIHDLQCPADEADTCLAPKQVEMNDWRTWRLGNSTTSAANSIHVLLMQDALMDAQSWTFDTSGDAKLVDFEANGGELLLAHGMADPIFSPNDTIDYYQRLTREHGDTAQDFARLFLIPSMSHCQGGAAYEGGDPANAASFVCREPENR